MFTACSLHVLLMFSPCSKLGIFMYWTGNSMENLLSYCGLVDAKIRGSDIDLPVEISVKNTFLWPNPPTQSLCRRNIGMIPYTDQKISLSINTMHNTLVHNGVQNYYKVTFVRLSFTNKFIIISSNCLEIGQFWSSISSIQT